MDNLPTIHPIDLTNLGVVKEMDLSPFIGTTAYYKSSPFSPVIHTDGVQYFCDTAGAHWFKDIVVSEYATLPETILKIDLIVANGKATINVEDGDCKRIKQRKIDFTDCPSGTYEFFFIDGVFMLTSEY